jgi:hypothetical protein
MRAAGRLGHGEVDSAAEDAARFACPSYRWGDSWLRSDLALDALEQALHAPAHDTALRRPLEPKQYLSFGYTERLAAAGIEASP